MKRRSPRSTDLKTIPRMPQVQLIGNDTVYNLEGLAEAELQHPHHKAFHADPVSDEDEAKGVTRFYRWCGPHLIEFLVAFFHTPARHIDAALYDLSP